VYVHAPTRRRLRFHHRGLLQAQYLPIEYQLLLAEHADNYRNPFALDAGMSSTDVEYHPGLFFESICLRRDTWCVPIALLGPLLGSDSLAAAAALRRWFHERIAAEDLWFYRLPRLGSAGNKPRLLDLASPLSTSAFKHAITSHEHAVFVSRMEPAVDDMWRIRGKSYVSELMVEV
jgi:hypothetical protein